MERKGGRQGVITNKRKGGVLGRFRNLPKRKKGKIAFPIRLGRKKVGAQGMLQKKGMADSILTRE